MRATKQICKNQKGKVISPLDDPDLHLWILIDQTRDTMLKARELELSQYKLSRVQGKVLFILLSENRGLTLAEISNWNVREPNSVLNLVNRMEKSGLVKKIRSDYDDKVRIVPTEKGRKMYINASRMSIDMIVSILSEEEKRQLKSTLRKLRNKSRKLLGIDYKPPFLP